MLSKSANHLTKIVGVCAEIYSGVCTWHRLLTIKSVSWVLHSSQNFHLRAEYFFLKETRRSIFVTTLIANGCRIIIITTQA
jgi:hypothetical protein